MVIASGLASRAVGVLYKSGDAGSPADALRSLLGDTTRIREMGVRTSEFAHAGYIATDVVAPAVAVLEERAGVSSAARSVTGRQNT
jgi:hypothetical protein